MLDSSKASGFARLARAVLVEVLDHAADALDDIADLPRETGPAATREEASAPVDGESVARFTWTGAFASDLKVGQVIRVDGRYVDDAPGLRVLRITELRASDRETLGGVRAVVSLLLVDVDSGRARSLSSPGEMAFEVGVEVPDGVPVEFTGGAA